MKDRCITRFEDRRMAEGFLAQAHLCEHIASVCSDEETARKFQALAQDCKQAATSAATP
jgi:hypothetical protein